MTSASEHGAHVAIIGAGVAGLAAAARLSLAGHRVTVFEKSKGLGGRLATRRGDAGDFDHGAPGFVVSDPGFARVVEAARIAGGAVAWPGGRHNLLTQSEGTAFTGLPGASGFARALAATLPGGKVTIRHGATIDRVARAAPGWQLADVTADALLLAIPAPQAAALLTDVHPGLATRAASVPMVAVMTAMLGFERQIDPHAVANGPGSPIIAKAILHSTKPGRAGEPLQRWVVHATPDWSAAHADDSKEAIALDLAAAFSAASGAPAAAHAAGHRWRYAYAALPLGEAAPGDDRMRLALAGDWCLGDGVEHAWRSGHSAAGRVIAALDRAAPSAR
ncbi:MAG: FAD-dependent oxidoreductase [Pseudomonadota bacterium]